MVYLAAFGGEIFVDGFESGENPQLEPRPS